jgi:hypothetical protein
MDDASFLACERVSRKRPIQEPGEDLPEVATWPQRIVRAI